MRNIFCRLITFDNPLNASFSNKKYPFTIKTQLTQIVKVYFLLKTRFLTIFKDYLLQNQLPITFCLDLVCNKTLQARNSTPHTRMSIEISFPLLLLF